MFDVEQPVVVANGQIHRHACCGVKLLHERKSALAHREALVDEVAEFQQPESKTPLSGGILLDESHGRERPQNSVGRRG